MKDCRIFIIEMSDWKKLYNSTTQISKLYNTQMFFKRELYLAMTNGQLKNYKLFKWEITNNIKIAK